jgi:hypothetical protein
MNDDIRHAQLVKKAEEAVLIKQMCESPGFKIIQTRFEEKIKKATNLILDMNTPEETVKSLRQKIHVWTEVTSMLKSLILTGNYASSLLRDENDLDTQTTPVLDGQGE